MFPRHISVRPVLMGAVIIVLIVLGQTADRSMAAARDLDAATLRIALPMLDRAADAVQPEAVVDCVDTTCPSGPAALDKCVERTKFCVYYTTASISESEAEWAADVVEDYWDRFVALGFNEPKYSTKLRVELTDITNDCNGGSSWDSNAIDTYAGCFDVTLLAQKVLGHELTHRVQYAHDTSPGAPIQTKMLKEGTARATEDNWFTEIDHWAAALSHSSFNSEANQYLLDTEYDITSYDMRYESCLWWKYAMEQYGTILTEPERGIDFVLEVYEQSDAGHAGIAGINLALNAIGAGTTFDNSFKRFGAAIYTKDLSGLPDDSYDFDDEEEAGNPAVYGPLAPTDGGTIQIGTSASWTNQSITTYALRYYMADVGANCPVVSATFHRDGDGPAFYHVITQNGSVFNTHVEGSGEDWAQSFIDDGITSIVAVVGSLENSSQVDITLSCADPVLEIKMPNDVAVARVQPSTKFLAQVLVSNGAGGPVVAGLTNSHFTAQVGGVDATVTGGGFIQEQYWLVIRAPASLADGTYDLVVNLVDPDSGTPLASDTSASSIVYTIELTDQALVIDRSGSMGWTDPTRLSAAQDAAAFYVDVTRDGDGLTVVPYNHDINPAPFPIDEVDDSLRTAAKTYINGLDPADGSTSIGDGLNEALNQFASSPTGNTLCSFVLLSDGMENTPLMWSEVMTDVIDSGCPVTAIAFGPESDETLMQSIASATGGVFFYNDVYVSSPLQSTIATAADMALDLGNSYEYSQAFAEDRQRLLAEKGVVSAKNPYGWHEVLIDDTISEAVFSLDWYQTWYAEVELLLYDPNGNQYDQNNPGYSFKDEVNRHVGFRIKSPLPGTWQLLVRHLQSEEVDVPYQVIVSGQSLITLELLLPDRLGLQFMTGNQVPIYGILSADGPIPDADVTALVTSPNGMQVLVQLYDDGEHDDGAAQDGLYGGMYTAVNQAEVVWPNGEQDETPPNDEGGYRVLLRAVHEKFYREAMGAFSVLEGPDEDQSGYPDAWEKQFDIVDLKGDPDLDRLLNYEEYQHGTNPQDSDSDDGGEGDGSEVYGGRDPLNPADDLIEKPDFLSVRPWVSAVALQFDFKPAYNFINLFRRLGEAGDWSLIYSSIGIPPSGIYTDTQVTNGQIYFYRLEAVVVSTTLSGGEVTLAEIASGLLTSEGVTPSADPFLPEAYVIINLGAPATDIRDVSLTFAPYEQEGSEPDAFSDITQVMLSNSPDFEGAVWQPFEQGIPWTLDILPVQVAHVYARFMDSSGNVSAGVEIDSILYQPLVQMLPVAMKY